MVEVHRRYFFIWENGDESLAKCINKLNSSYPTIKFAAEYLKKNN